MAKKFTSNTYFTLSEGLSISDETGSVLINIKAESTKEVTALANILLDALNHEYLRKKALFSENHLNFEMGLITKKEYEDRVQDIIKNG